MPTLHSVKNVEVFSVGTWNGDKYTESDLDAMVTAFEETADTYRPPLKFGHEENQTILQQGGKAAAGWIGKLYRKGEKLLADFIDIPKEIFTLLEQKSYRKVSAEIHFRAKVNGKNYPRLMSAVALLGAERPAVTNLKDIFALKCEDDTLLKCYTLKPETFNIKKMEGEMPEDKEKLKKLEDENAELKAKLKTLEDELGKMKKKNEGEFPPKKENEEEKKENTAKDAEIKKMSAEIAELRQQRDDERIEREVTELQSEGLITKAMRPYIKSLLGKEVKTYSLDDKSFTKNELLREVLKLNTEAVKVNFTENSNAGKKESDKNYDAQDQKIKKYMKEHDCDYASAYKAVLKSA